MNSQPMKLASQYHQKNTPLAVSQRLMGVVLLSLLFVAGAVAQSADSTGEIHGTVFVVDPQGRAYIPGATVVLSGKFSSQQETDETGRFDFHGVPAGSYTISVNFPGFSSVVKTVTSDPGQVVEAEVELKVAAATTSVTVSETASELQTSAPVQTISSALVQKAPNQNERAESLLPLVPGVVRGPDGRINMKGARNSQSGALVNSANATDPASGTPGLDLPIDVVASVQVISNPYDAQYGKLTGAVSTIETKTSNYEKLHFSVQNVVPRMRVRDGSVLGVGGATPRATMTGPILNNRLAVTQSVEYRFIRNPVNSLPASERDTKLESVNSYTQFDLNLTSKQTATFSVSLYPQKLQHLGLSTFMPEDSTPDYHQRGYQLYGQHRYLVGKAGMLTSQMSYKTFDVDITSKTDEPYRVLVETAEGGFFNQQARRASRLDLEEKYEFAPRQFWGVHQVKSGFDYSYSTYDGRQRFRPFEIDSVSGVPIERATFGPPTSVTLHQHETSGFLTDQWSPIQRLNIDLGLRFDSDTITSSVHAAPRAGIRLALTADGKTMLKGGGGIFYDRVPLMIPAFENLPDRTVNYLDTAGNAINSVLYVNKVQSDLGNPRSTAWSVALSRELTRSLIVETGFESRVTSQDFIVSPVAGTPSTLLVSNGGGQSYREFHVLGRYHFRENVLNASYVRSRAYGNLNDFFQYFGNVTKPVVSTDDKGRLAFDAPNRVLIWGDFKAPWKINFIPVYDIHTGFPYSVQNEYREYIGPRNERRYPRFASFDVQALRPFSIHLGEKHVRAKAGVSIFNLFNHFNPREVQNVSESSRFGQFFNDAWREYRGKFVIEF